MDCNSISFFKSVYRAHMPFSYTPNNKQESYNLIYRNTSFESVIVNIINDYFFDYKPVINHIRFGETYTFSTTPSSSCFEITLPAIKSFK